jgi:hypothetical protein
MGVIKTDSVPAEPGRNVPRNQKDLDPHPNNLSCFNAPGYMNIIN